MRMKQDLRSNGSPSNQTPVLFDTPAECHLFANVGASRAYEDKLGSIVLDGGDLGTGGGGADVDHDELVLGEFGDLGLLAVGGPNTEQTTEQVEVDFDFTVDLGESALETEDETDETISSAEGRVDAGTDTNKTAGNGVLEVVGLGVERDDAREDGRALEGTTIVTGDDTRSNFNLVAQLDDAVQDGPTGDTTFEVVNLSTRLVDIK